MYYTFEKRTPHHRQLCNSNCSQLKILIPSLCGAICFVSSTSALGLGSEQGWTRHILGSGAGTSYHACYCKHSFHIQAPRSDTATERDSIQPSSAKRLPTRMALCPGTAIVAATKADQNISKPSHAHIGSPSKKCGSLALWLCRLEMRLQELCAVVAWRLLTQSAPDVRLVHPSWNTRTHSECIPFPIHFHVCLHCFTLESHFVYIVPSVFSCRSICETNSVRPFDVKVLDPILIFALHKAILANCKRESLESLGESLHVQTKWSGTPSLTSHQKSEKWSGTRDNLQSKKSASSSVFI